MIHWQRSFKSSNSPSTSVSLVIFTALRILLSEYYWGVCNLLQEILPPNEYSYSCQRYLGNLPSFLWALIAQEYLWTGMDFCSLLAFHLLPSGHSNLHFIWGTTYSPFHVVPPKAPPPGWSLRQFPSPGHSDSRLPGLMQQEGPHKDKHHILWDGTGISNQRWTLELGWAQQNQSIRKLI